MEAYETYNHANCEINIYPDDDPLDPRVDYDNLATMICWHSRYNLGDKHDFSDPQEFYDWSKENLKGGIVLQLYLYDHSGISMSCSSFIGRSHHGEWDSGPVGYIYITADKVRKEYSAKRISKKLRERVAGYLKGEVEEYDQYLRGAVYGYIVEHDESGEEDSCWGYFGMEYCISEAKIAAADLNRSHLETVAADLEECRQIKQSRVKQLIHAHVPLNIRQGIVARLS